MLGCCKYAPISSSLLGLQLTIKKYSYNLHLFPPEFSRDPFLASECLQTECGFLFIFKDRSMELVSIFQAESKSGFFLNNNHPAIYSQTEPSNPMYL